MAEVIETVHDLVEAWARLEPDRPGAGRAQVDALSGEDAEALWERYAAEEAVVANAERHLRRLRRSSRFRRQPMLDDP